VPPISRTKHICPDGSNGLLLTCGEKKRSVIHIIICYYCKRTYGLGSQCRPNECLFGSGKPQGVGILGRGPDGQVREIQGSVYEQPKEEVDGSSHSKEGSK
jgi:hypothetical protein